MYEAKGITHHPPEMDFGLNRTELIELNRNSFIAKEFAVVYIGTK